MFHGQHEKSRRSAHVVHAGTELASTCRNASRTKVSPWPSLCTHPEAKMSRQPSGLVLRSLSPRGARLPGKVGRSSLLDRMESAIILRSSKGFCLSILSCSRLSDFPRNVSIGRQSKLRKSCGALQNPMLAFIRRRLLHVVPCSVRLERRHETRPRTGRIVGRHPDGSAGTCGRPGTRVHRQSALFRRDAVRAYRLLACECDVADHGAGRKKLRNNLAQFDAFADAAASARPDIQSAVRPRQSERLAISQLGHRGNDVWGRAANDCRSRCSYRADR